MRSTSYSLSERVYESDSSQYHLKSSEDSISIVIEKHLSCLDLMMSSSLKFLNHLMLIYEMINLSFVKRNDVSAASTMKMFVSSLTYLLKKKTLQTFDWCDESTLGNRKRILSGS